MNKIVFCLILGLGLLASQFSRAQTAPWTSYIQDDIKIGIASASATSWQGGAGIDKSYDGDFSTLYHSNWNNGSPSYFPITLFYHFSGASDLDYMMYTTRSGSNNGNFKLIEIEARTGANGTYQPVASVDLKGVAGTHKIDFDTKLVGITSIKIIVRSGAGDGQGFASCAEMGFFKKNDGAFDLTSVFTDASCSRIKENISRADLETIDHKYYRQLALDIFDKNYPDEFRVQTYKAWPHPNTFSHNNRVGTYSLMDNPTGIYVNEGDTVMVYIDDTNDYNISLRLTDYYSEDGNGYHNNSYYPLYNGANKVIANRNGLFYVYYHTEDHLTAPNVKIHFAYGKVNGYYDSEKHTEADWSRLLNAAEHPYFDALGKYAHTTFPTDKFKANAATTGPLLIQYYNELVQMQREHMGYYKYPNRDPYNRSHFVVMYHAYMYSAGNHTGYNIDTMDGLTTANNLRRYPWGPAHEVGHSNQHSPLLKWVGTTEVTNNIHSLLVETEWGNTSRLTRENRYNEAFNDIILDNKAHCQVDIWRKLVPFWQLQLFFANVLEQKDFYSMIYEGARTRSTGSNPGEHQMNFVKIVIDSAEVDLTEFFDTWGFLKPVDQRVEDYWTDQLTITETQSANLKNYIKDKSFPVLPYKIQYITDSNWEIYKNKTEVVQGTAVRFGNNYIMSDWESVVAYEAWQGETMVGLTQSDELKVRGEVTENTKVYAAQYDGTKIEVNAALEISSVTPELSEGDNEHWYIVKNMDNNKSNTRQYSSLSASGVNQTIGANILPALKSMRWKLVEVNGKTALQNEAGHYLAQNMTASETPFGWDLESVSQGGSSGFRFAAYNATSLQTVAHLSTGLKLMNYTPGDAASVWQFVPADQIKPSDEELTHYYNIKSMRYESSLIGTSLGYEEGNAWATAHVNGQSKWKIVNYNSANGSCNIMTEDGSYLSTSGANITISAVPKVFYIYLTNLNGIVGYRIATSTTTSSYMLNLSDTKNLSLVTTIDQGSLWQFIPASEVPTSVKPNLGSQERIYGQNGKIVSNMDKDVKVFTLTGRQVKNRNLSNGLYLVKTNFGIHKFVLRD